MFCFVKQKTAYEMRISDWSSDVCSSDLSYDFGIDRGPQGARRGSTACPASAGDDAATVAAVARLHWALRFVAARRTLNKLSLRAACSGVWNCTRTMSPTGGA